MNSVIEQKIKEIHTKWLSKAKTATIDGSEMTVLPYGYLSQAVEEALRTHTEQLKERVEGLKYKLRDKHKNDGWTFEEKQKVAINKSLDDILAIFSEDK